MVRPSRSELLMPAGSLEKLKIAILYGADAVYLGTPDMSLRTKSAFTLEEVVEGIEFAHRYHKRVYLTLNLFTHNKDVPKLEEYIATVRKVQPDGLIIADPGVFQYVKEHAPELELHISTQANICSWLSVKFWESIGAKLVVLAREVSYAELIEIREKCPEIKLEAFIHGSMCMTYSGRCMLSNYMVERGANQGNCANSCRWKYKVHMKLKDGTIKEIPLTEENLELFDFFLEEEHRGGELMEIMEDDRGTYILNSKDLCLLPKLDEYLSIGVDSLKVEGRGKSPYYVAMVARIYRKAIDDWYNNPTGWDPTQYMKEMQTVPNRGYTFAFHEGRLTNHAHNFEDTQTLADWEFAGMITEVHEDGFIVEVKNQMEAGDVLEFISPVSDETVFLRIYEFMHYKNGQVIKTTCEVHAGQKPYIKIPLSAFDHEDFNYLKHHLPPYSIIRKERSLSQAEWDRIALDKVAQGVELSKKSEKEYWKKLDKLRVSKEEGTRDKHFKTPRLGIHGCCGRGCNGCLIFWYDEKYLRARENLAGKKQGEMLERTRILCESNV